MLAWTTALPGRLPFRHELVERGFRFGEETRMLRCARGTRALLFCAEEIFGASGFHIV
jgi:hypothetical protein